MKEKLPSVLSSEGPFSPLFLHSPFHPIVSFFPSFPPSHFPSARTAAPTKKGSIFTDSQVAGGSPFHSQRRRRINPGFFGLIEKRKEDFYWRRRKKSRVRSLPPLACHSSPRKFFLFPVWEKERGLSWYSTYIGLY